jgi:hypothetical protein
MIFPFLILGERKMEKKKVKRNYFFFISGRLYGKFDEIKVQRCSLKNARSMMRQIIEADAKTQGATDSKQIEEYIQECLKEKRYQATEEDQGYPVRQVWFEKIPSKREIIFDTHPQSFPCHPWKRKLDYETTEIDFDCTDF